MKKFAGFTKEQVDAELMWVAIHNNGERFIGTYAEVTAHSDTFESNKYDCVECIEVAGVEDQTADMVRFVEAWERINKRFWRFIPYGDLFRAYSIEEVANL